MRKTGWEGGGGGYGFWDRIRDERRGEFCSHPDSCEENFSRNGGLFCANASEIREKLKAGK